MLVQHTGRFIKLPLIRYFHAWPFPKHVHTDGYNMLCCSLGVLAPTETSFLGEGGSEPALPNSHRGLLRNHHTACPLGTASCQEVSGLFAFNLSIQFHLLRELLSPSGYSGLLAFRGD